MVPPDDIKPPPTRQGYRGNRPRMGGDRKLKPREPAMGASRHASAAETKQRVLFVCVGNSCRSQMAEAFAKAYGADIMLAQSAGLSPAMIIAPMTKQMLAERNLNIDDHFPKGMEAFARETFDVVVNMSGRPLHLPNARILTWVVRDPIGESEAVYRGVVQQIEGLVMGLILSLRNKQALAANEQK
jgi:arsenate reductase (thioredoxin)